MLGIGLIARSVHPHAACGWGARLSAQCVLLWMRPSPQNCSGLHGVHLSWNYQTNICITQEQITRTVWCRPKGVRDPYGLLVRYLQAGLGRTTTWRSGVLITGSITAVITHLEGPLSRVSQPIAGSQVEITQL